MVTFSSNEIPIFVGFRDGNATWFTISRPSAFKYEFTASDDYEATFVWGGAGGTFSTETLAATVADATLWDMDSLAPSSLVRDCVDVDIQGSVFVDGTVSQPGTVVLGSSCVASASESWKYHLSVQPGTHDFFATTATPTNAASSHRVVIRRDQDTSASTTLDSVDFTTEGVGLMHVPISLIGGTAGESVVVSTLLDTSSGQVALASDLVNVSSPLTAQVLGSDALRSGERQSIDLRLDTSDGRQWAHQDIEQNRVMNLLPLPDAAVCSSSATDASWTSLSSRVQYVDFVIYSSSAQRGVASSRWLRKYDASSVSVDGDIPGYQSDWKVDTTKPYYAAFSTSSNELGVSYWAGIVRQGPCNQ